MRACERSYRTNNDQLDLCYFEREQNERRFVKEAHASDMNPGGNNAGRGTPPVARRVTPQGSYLNVAAELMEELSARSGSASRHANSSQRRYTSTTDDSLQRMLEQMRDGNPDELDLEMQDPPNIPHDEMLLRGNSAEMQRIAQELHRVVNQPTAYNKVSENYQAPKPNQQMPDAMPLMPRPASFSDVGDIFQGMPGQYDTRQRNLQSSLLNPSLSPVVRTGAALRPPPVPYPRPGEDSRGFSVNPGETPEDPFSNPCSDPASMPRELLKKLAPHIPSTDALIQLMQEMCNEQPQTGYAGQNRQMMGGDLTDMVPHSQQQVFQSPSSEGIYPQTQTSQCGMVFGQEDSQNLFCSDPVVSPSPSPFVNPGEAFQPSNFGLTNAPDALSQPEHSSMFSTSGSASGQMSYSWMPTGSGSLGGQYTIHSFGDSAAQSQSPQQPQPQTHQPPPHVMQDIDQIINNVTPMLGQQGGPRRIIIIEGGQQHEGQPGNPGNVHSQSVGEGVQLPRYGSGQGTAQVYTGNFDLHPQLGSGIGSHTPIIQQMPPQQIIQQTTVVNAVPNTPQFQSSNQPFHFGVSGGTGSLPRTDQTGPTGFEGGSVTTGIPGQFTVGRTVSSGSRGTSSSSRGRVDRRSRVLETYGDGTIISPQKVTRKNLQGEGLPHCSKAGLGDEEVEQSAGRSTDKGKGDGAVQTLSPKECVERIRGAVAAGVDLKDVIPSEAPGDFDPHFEEMTQRMDFEERVRRAETKMQEHLADMGRIESMMESMELDKKEGQEMWRKAYNRKEAAASRLRREKQLQETVEKKKKLEQLEQWLRQHLAGESSFYKKPSLAVVAQTPAKPFGSVGSRKESKRGQLTRRASTGSIPQVKNDSHAKDKLGGSSSQ